MITRGAVGRARARRAHVVWIVVGSVMVAACATLGPDPQTIAQRAEREEAALLKRVKVYDDPPLAEYLTAIAGTLDGQRTDVVAMRPRVRITVIEDPTLAAFALPGGRLFLHTGLLSRVESEGQLAAVIAWELARDAWKPAERSRNAGGSRGTLGPTASAVIGLDLTLVASAAIDGDGRDRERAADAEALRRHVSAGYDPADARKLFETLARDGADRAGLREVFVYGTPMRMAERSDAVRRLVDKLPAADGVTRRAADAGEFARRMVLVVRENAALDARAGRFALARRQLDRVLAVTPTDAVAHTYDGDLYRLRSQGMAGPARDEAMRNALERYQRALQLDPHYADVLRQLALLRYQQGDLAAARAAFERYVTLKPDAPDAPRVREYLAALGD